MKVAMIEFKCLSICAGLGPDEQAAIDHFTAIRWRNGAFCLLCGSTKDYHFSDKRTHKCRNCRRRFSIKVGTIFQDAKIPIQKWLMAIWMLTSHKKCIASTTLARDIDVTQKTAWFMLHRSRQAALSESFNAPLEGEIEVDETYVGGETHNRHKGNPKNQPDTGGKTAVIGALERGGEVAARVVEKTETPTLDRFVHAVVDPSATQVSSDERSGYRHLVRTYRHQVVRHSAGEYVRGGCRTNEIEGFWSPLKRQIIGIRDVVSPRQLNRYVGEVAWRFNRRGAEDGLRLNALLAAADCDPLRYRALGA